MAVDERTFEVFRKRIPKLPIGHLGFRKSVLSPDLDQYKDPGTDIEQLREGYKQRMDEVAGEIGAEALIAAAREKSQDMGAEALIKQAIDDIELR